MPVVQIRHMRMTVDHRFVRVGMRVPMGGGQPGVHVIVVTVVVTMAVRVLHRLVDEHPPRSASPKRGSEHGADDYMHSASSPTDFRGASDRKSPLAGRASSSE